ncbi:glycosyltransferase family 4 protein [Chlorogloea sp. CCALA 695]|uniref:glycosyltransferase family 4 protein n=1 Tax=Chlorogloea sp. CCALA 695 TaxID=2107693 RepID=UPI000D06861A|nr:glycosyltransferase family 1 protein [Chlorogloea sp. CCALA 695]PSB35123.1 glycosyltransferase family 1 protein [Chlorogloea sp. CCALA 695]
MKVAYDISILGAGYLNPKARTGVFRVVEALFLAIAAQSNVDLMAIALNQTSTLWDEISANLYLESFNSEPKKYLDSCYGSKLNLDNIYLSAVNLHRSLIQFSVQNHPLIYKSAQGFKILLELAAKINVDVKNIDKKYDLYHSSYYPLPSSNILGSTPRVLTIYDLIPILFPKVVTPKVNRQFIKTLESIDFNKDWIICISQHTKNDFCQRTRINPERVFVTPLAASKKFYPVNEISIIKSVLKSHNISESPYLLSISTLEPRKNLTLLIKCFCQIVTENPNLDLNLVLVGVSGWKNKDIFEIVEKNSQLKSRIIFTGYIPDNDLSAIYSGAIAFVYPSLYEGFGLPPLEAMQCGIPVITSNTSSLPEVVGNAGITIDPTQSDELCQAMLDVVNNSKLRAQMSLLSLEQASKFSWKKCAEQTVEVYKIAANK